MAKLVGISQQAIQKLESGKAEASRRLTEIAVACGVRPEWLSSESGPMVAKAQVKDEEAPAYLATQSHSHAARTAPETMKAASEALLIFLRRRDPKATITLSSQEDAELLAAIMDLVGINDEPDQLAAAVADFMKARERKNGRKGGEDRSDAGGKARKAGTARKT